MSEHTKPSVDTSSLQFKKGVEAGLNSPEDTKNWQAGNELGQELKVEGETKQPASKSSFDSVSTPLFMKARSANHHGNAQDEKTETAE